MSFTNIEACYICANDAGTIANMQQFIIPSLNSRREDMVQCIKHLSADPQTCYMVAEFQKEKDDIDAAIDVFYSRFPDLQRVTHPFRIGYKEYSFNI